MYLSIKKVTETTEEFTLTNIRSSWDINRIKQSLLDGDLNIVPVACVEPIMWLVNKSGVRIAVLEKEGGSGPSEHVTIDTGTDNCLD